MSHANLDPELDKALEELQQYLSDILPPLMVSDSISLLMRYPPQIVATNIHAWVMGQYQRSHTVPLADYLFHAIHKIHLMSEYKLIPQEELSAYLENLKQVVLEFCPSEDREMLRLKFDHMEQAPSALSAPTIRRPSGEEHSPVRSEAPKDVDAWRIGLMLHRLEKELPRFQAGSSKMDTAPPATARVTEVLAEAAKSSQTPDELQRSLDHLRRLGIEAGTDDVFRALGRNLPGWALMSGPGVTIPENSNLKAMRRIVSQAKDPAEAATRFYQMIKAAVEQLNEGQLIQAAAMIDLAEKMISGKEVDRNIVDNVRRSGDENVDLEKLPKLAENQEQQGLLRKVMNFFLRMSPKGLLEALRTEEKRERRRSLLSLLEIHGETAYAVLLDHLRIPLGTSTSEEEWYFRRNLFYLLRRLRVPGGVKKEELMAVAYQHSNVALPPILLKEVVAFLSQQKHEKAAQILKTMLHDLESVLLESSKNEGGSEELLILLNRVVGALSRLGTHAARRTAIDHALKKNPELGDTIARLSEFAGQDLSDDRETTRLLLETLKANLPTKVFGIVLKGKDHNLQAIVEALSGTPLPEVKKTLEEITQRFPGRPAARAAARVLAGFEKMTPQNGLPEVTAAPEAPPATASLMGDLDLFGLPALLQSLSDSSLSGTLVLKKHTGEIFGTIEILKGSLASCNTGAITGESAFYQLFEQPVPGTFVFTRGSDKSDWPESELKSFLPLSLEGMRRYDELQQARALLPDDVRLTPKASQPAPLPDEKDGLLFRNLWNAVQNFATPLECESVIPVDSYRIRRLLVHWLQSGVLEAV